MRSILFAPPACLVLSHAAFRRARRQSQSRSKAAPVLICPVTGEKIASVKDAVGSSVYKGKTYYFCCSSCKPSIRHRSGEICQTGVRTARRRIKPCH